MWKLLFQSVRGPAHERDGRPCQDSCLVRLHRSREAHVLVMACAAGAESARHAGAGARVACRGIVRIVLDDLREGLPVAHVDRDTALSWLRLLQPYLMEEARAHLAGVEQLACTLLLAVVGDEAAAFAQVGDGAILVRKADTFRPVFWPQTGPAGEVCFVTDPSCEQHLAFDLRPGRVEDVAMLTGGLQRLALSFAERSAHQPFFEPLFRKLRDAAPGGRLPVALREFLSSAAVKGRSDDDKTLLLAARPGAAHAEKNSANS
jgi:hypothetical protein